MKLSVRIYSSGRNVRGIIINEIFVSLEENFSDDGGLNKYSTYSIGLGVFKYRNMTLNEFKSLNLDLKTEIHIHGNDRINIQILGNILKEIIYLDREKKLKNILK